MTWRALNDVSWMFYLARAAAGRRFVRDFRRCMVIGINLRWFAATIYRWSGPRCCLSPLRVLTDRSERLHNEPRVKAIGIIFVCGDDAAGLRAEELDPARSAGPCSGLHHAW